MRLSGTERRGRLSSVEHVQQPRQPVATFLLLPGEEDVGAPLEEDGLRQRVLGGVFEHSQQSMHFRAVCEAAQLGRVRIGLAPAYGERGHKLDQRVEAKVPAGVLGHESETRERREEGRLVERLQAGDDG